MTTHPLSYHVFIGDTERGIVFTTEEADLISEAYSGEGHAGQSRAEADSHAPPVPNT